MRTLLDGDKQDVGYADNAAEQCEQTNHPKESVDDVDALLHLHVLCVAVPDPDTSLVIGMGLVVGVEPAAVLFLKVCVLLLCLETVESELDVADVAAIGAINALNG